MSFLSTLGSIFSKVGHGVQTGLQIEQQAAPVVSMLPGGGIVNTVVTGIMAVESLFPQSGLGAQKSALVTAAATSVAPGIDPAATQAAIAQIVQAFNALQSLATKAPAPSASPTT